MQLQNWEATETKHAWGLPEEAPSVAAINQGQRSNVNDEIPVRLAAVLESSPDAILTTNVVGEIISWNPAAERIYGYMPQEIIGQHVATLFSSDQAVVAEELSATLKSGERISNLESVHIRKNGVRIAVLLTAAPVIDTRGHIILGSMIVRDVTDVGAMKEQLRQSQKMEAIGMLASGIAHDFNNLLTVIQGRSDLILNDSKTSPASRDNAVLVLQTAQRAARLTRQLLQYSHPQKPQTNVIDLHNLLLEMEELLRRLVSADTDIQLVLNAKTPTVRADRSQMQQVVLNLVVNANDAMPQGGKITICTQDLTQEGSGGQRPRILLAVSDTGCGMDPMVQSRIFEPFFTTKGNGRGTGLGLFTVSEIVKQSEGEIVIDSEPGHGTTFKVCLPLVASAPSALSNCNLKAVQRGSETILLAEDDTAIRGLLHQFIAAEGYSVLVAHDGEHAIRVANEYSGKIDLMLADVVMPRLNGKQTASKIVATRHPAMKVVYMSAYGIDSLVSRGLTDDTDVLLQKPFLPKVVLQKIREILDGTSSNAYCANAPER